MYRVCDLLTKIARKTFDVHDFRNFDRDVDHTGVIGRDVIDVVRVLQRHTLVILITESDTKPPTPCKTTDVLELERKIIEIVELERGRKRYAAGVPEQRTVICMGVNQRIDIIGHFGTISSRCGH